MSRKFLADMLQALFNITADITYGILRVKSSQVTFIYIALFTMQIVSKQLYSDSGI